MRPHQSASRSLLFASLVLVTLCGCSRAIYLPPVATSYVPVDPEDVYDLEPYCTLTYSHFQADEPPAQYASMKNRIAAVTTVLVYATNPVIDAVEVPANPDSTRWVADIEDLRWEALVVPKASWWNPKKTKPDDIRKILEHEQGHFALAELEARRENTQISETMKRIRAAAAPTHAGAIVQTTRNIKKERERILASMLAWNAKYDIETKNGTEKKVQAEWTARLAKRLGVVDQEAGD